MRNPLYLAHLFADIETRVLRTNQLHEVFQQMGAIPMQGGATR